jgi:hypothetical protein
VNWEGTAVCLASGPSLTSTDIERVIAWRDTSPDHHIIVCNTTFRNALTADALLGGDARWWKVYYAEVLRTFQGERYSVERLHSDYVVQQIKDKSFRFWRNSGTDAVSLAIWLGCEAVILLGYDSQFGPNGERHHHADHPTGLDNATLTNWPRKFKALAEYVRLCQIPVWNCTRSTALTEFPHTDLEATLAAC